MQNYYLYKITNLVNGKLYIGVTKHPDKRRRQHFYKIRSKSTSLVNSAVQKYGVENFTFNVICVGSQDYIYDLESKAISLYSSNTRDGGYNLRAGGKGGEGSKVEKRSDDKPKYVSGFWFPNKRTVVTKLNVPSSTLHGWYVRGCAGDECKTPAWSFIGKPVYVGGFWFNDIYRAVEILNLDINTIKHRIKTGQTEAAVNNPGRPKQRIVVDGVIYDSINHAERETEYTRKMLYSRLKKNLPNIKYYVED